MMIRYINDDLLMMNISSDNSDKENSDKEH